MKSLDTANTCSLAAWWAEMVRLTDIFFLSSPAGCYLSQTGLLPADVPRRVPPIRFRHGGRWMDVVLLNCRVTPKNPDTLDSGWATTHKCWRVDEKKLCDLFWHQNSEQLQLSLGRDFPRTYAHSDKNLSKRWMKSGRNPRKIHHCTGEIAVTDRKTGAGCRESVVSLNATRTRHLLEGSQNMLNVGVINIFILVSNFYRTEMSCIIKKYYWYYHFFYLKILIEGKPPLNDFLLPLIEIFIFFKNITIA